MICGGSRETDIFLNGQNVLFTATCTSCIAQYWQEYVLTIFTDYYTF